jgi:hypothetical protein
MKNYFWILITILASGITWFVTGNWTFGAVVLIGTAGTALVNHFTKNGSN